MIIKLNSFHQNSSIKNILHFPIIGDIIYRGLRKPMYEFINLFGNGNLFMMNIMRHIMYFYCLMWYYSFQILAESWYAICPVYNHYQLFALVAFNNHENKCLPLTFANNIIIDSFICKKNFDWQDNYMFIVNHSRQYLAWVMVYKQFNRFLLLNDKSCTWNRNQ